MYRDIYVEYIFSLCGGALRAAVVAAGGAGVATGQRHQKMLYPPQDGMCYRLVRRWCAPLHSIRVLLSNGAAPTDVRRKLRMKKRCAFATLNPEWPSAAYSAINEIFPEEKKKEPIDVNRVSFLQPYPPHLSSPPHSTPLILKSIYALSSLLSADSFP